MTTDPTDAGTRLAEHAVEHREPVADCEWCPEVPDPTTAAPATPGQIDLDASELAEAANEWDALQQALASAVVRVQELEVEVRRRTAERDMLARAVVHPDRVVDAARLETGTAAPATPGQPPEHAACVQPDWCGYLTQAAAQVLRGSGNLTLADHVEDLERRHAAGNPEHLYGSAPGVYQLPAEPPGVLAEVAEERQRQNEKWGEQNHPDGTGGPVMQSRAEEARAQCQFLAANGGSDWRAFLLEEVYEALAEEDPAALRTELIQVAAVAVQWVQAIDRRGPLSTTPPAGTEGEHG